MIFLARQAVRRPFLWLGLVLVVTLLLGAGLPQLELETGGAALYPTGNTVIEASELDRLRFEEPRQVVVLVSCREAVSCIATPAGFRFLRRIHDELESLPAVRGHGVESVASLIRIERRHGTVYVRRHLDDVPDAAVDFAVLLAAVRQHPLTDGLLLSPDGRFASLFVPLAENRPVAELVRELEVWRAGRTSGSARFELRVTGPEIAEATLGRIVLSDLSTFIPVMLVVICAILFLTFGNAGGVLIPMAEAGVVLLWTFGAMGWLGIPVTLVTTILPVVLMAMSITDEIHLLDRVRAQAPTLDRSAAVLMALGEVGRPIVMTSVTTALGFLSFLSASMQPLRDFGLLTAFGILAAMVLSFCWVPALIVVLPNALLTQRARRIRAPGLGLDRLARAAVRRPGAALAVGVAALLLVLPGLWQLRVQDSWIDNFDPTSALVRAEHDFNGAFWGSYRFDIVLDGMPDFFYSSSGAALMESVEALAREAPYVGGVESFLVPLGEVARAVGEEPPLSELPEMAVSDLATLAEMSASRLSLRRLLTDGGDAVRARLYVNSPDYVRAAALKSDLDRRLRELSIPSFVRVHYSGDLPVALEVVAEIVGNQLRSIGWTLLSVTAVLAVFFTGGRAALVAMVPVTAATGFLLGAMGILGVPLGIATSMFASLTVGVGVDFGIHFLHRYREERRRGASDSAALRATVEQTGQALRWNAVVLAFGFLVLTLSSLKPNHSLGFLLAAAMLACYLATLLFLPRLARLA